MQVDCTSAGATRYTTTTSNIVAAGAGTVADLEKSIGVAQAFLDGGWPPQHHHHHHYHQLVREWLHEEDHWADVLRSRRGEIAEVCLEPRMR